MNADKHYERAISLMETASHTCMHDGAMEVLLQAVAHALLSIARSIPADMGSHE